MSRHSDGSVDNQVTYRMFCHFDDTLFSETAPVKPKTTTTSSSVRAALGAPGAGNTHVDAVGAGVHNVSTPAMQEAEQDLTREIEHALARDAAQQQQQRMLHEAHPVALAPDAVHPRTAGDGETFRPTLGAAQVAGNRGEYVWRSLQDIYQALQKGMQHVV